MSNKKNKKTIKRVEQEEASDVSSQSTEDAEDVKHGEDEAEEEEEKKFHPDVPNDKVLESLTDMIEYYTEMAFLDRRERLKNMQAADYYWSLHPAHAINFGKLFIKTKLGLLLADGCSRPPYGTEDDIDLPMVKWDRDRWQFLKEDLVDIKGYIVRKDATVLVTGDADQAKAVEDDDEDAGRWMSHLFTKRLDAVVRTIEVNKAIAPVRASLQKQIEDQREGKPQVTKAALKELLEYMDTMDPENKIVVQQLFDEGLFEEETEGSAKKSASAKKRKASLGFVLIKQLQHFFEEKPFDLNFIQEKIEHLVQNWYIEVYGKADATLLGLRYGILKDSEIDNMLSPKRVRRSSAEQLKSASRSATKRTGRADPSLSTPRPPHAAAQQSGDDDPFFDAKTDLDNAKQPAKTQAELEELRKDRAALNTKHGNDPLAETLTAAAGAQGVARKRNHDEVNDDDEDGDRHERDSKLLEKKRSAIRLQFQDDIDEDDDDEEEEEPGNVTLSDLPNRAKAKAKSPGRLAPDQGIFTPTGRVQRRRFWTEEETIAVKEGVRTLGTGRWAEIKSDHEYILRNRTSVQIKDKWRSILVERKRNNEA